MTELKSEASLYDRLGGRTALRDLVRHFYADVRQHREIGPIFLSRIEDWPSHLEKITDFWAGATGGPSLYSGPMPWKHLQLGLEKKHFEVWLDLWERNCRARLSPPVAEEMIGRAHQIGARLKEIVAFAGRPQAGPPSAQ